ncbi:hypothetical protein TrLO_g885 [Triparma laevis f. longispina]|uniref:Uncharacterized protein n=1 Tax=Triparma laevis f. longispina TaxID=1714387 RepID=A0A9W6ZDQ6_9STRA|nr:hypothetical protein TrLO_g885 [Triparma laevis f. longispina]
MSKSVVTESNEGDESRKMSGKRGAKDEGNDNEEGIIVVPSAESLTISTVVSTAPPSWMTRLRKPELQAELDDRLIKYEMKDNKSVLIELLRPRVRCEDLISSNNFLNTDDYRRLLVPFLPDDTLMKIRLASKPWSRVADAFIDEGVKNGTMIVHGGNDISEEVADAQKERRELITRMVFIINITRIGDYACRYDLKSMTIPDSLQTLGTWAFQDCAKLIPSNIPTKNNIAVVSYLRSKQQQQQVEAESMQNLEDHKINETPNFT